MRTKLATVIALKGGHHVQLIRNEGAVEARTTAIQLVPAGAVRRIDAPAACSF